MVALFLHRKYSTGNSLKCILAGRFAGFTGDGPNITLTSQRDTRLCRLAKWRRCFRELDWTPQDDRQHLKRMKIKCGFQGYSGDLIRTDLRVHFFTVFWFLLFSCSSYCFKRWGHCFIIKSFIYCLLSQLQTLFGKLQALSSRYIIMQQSSNSLGKLCWNMKSNYLKEFLC